MRLRMSFWESILRVARIIFLAAGLVACQGGSENTPTGMDLTRAYQTAVADAQRVAPDKIVNTLQPIVAWNPDLIWEGVPGDSRVLVASWVSGDWYDASVGQDYVLPDWLALWVTAVPEVRRVLQNDPYSSCSTPSRCKLRIEQLLGLPPDTSNTKFVEMWVDVTDLARPCPDPEVSDSVCELDYPSERFQQISPEWKSWFEQNQADSYVPANPYPWTQLGYTCDWFMGVGCAVGVSEFLVWKGATVGIRSVVTTEHFAVEVSQPLFNESEPASSD